METQGPGWMERFISLSTAPIPSHASVYLRKLWARSHAWNKHPAFCFWMNFFLRGLQSHSTWTHIPGAGCLSSELPMHYPWPMHSHRSCKTVVSLVQFYTQSTVDLQTWAFTGQLRSLALTGAMDRAAGVTGGQVQVLQRHLLPSRALSVALFLVISSITREPKCPFGLCSSSSCVSRLGRGHLFWSSFCYEAVSQGRSHS